MLLLGAEAVYARSRDFPLTAPEQPVRGQFGAPSLPPLKFVVLGDSTTVGVGTTPDKSFPWLLATRLSDRFHVTLEVVGFGGATTAMVADIQVDQALAARPNLVLVEVGANDTTHVTSLGTVESKIASALDRLVQSGARVVVAGPPNMGTSPVMPEPLRTVAGWRGAAVGRRIEQEARERNLAFIDLGAGTREQFKSEPDKYYSSDWFHPGDQGYALWADVMYPTVRQEAEKLL